MSLPMNAMEERLAWGLLVVAGLLEVCWAIGLKYTEGFTRVLPSVLTVGAMVLRAANTTCAECAGR